MLPTLKATFKKVKKPACLSPFKVAFDREVQRSECFFYF